MFKKLALTIAALTVFMVVPTLAGTGCNKINFFGSYTYPESNVDIFGDGSIIHSFVTQLSIHSDGTFVLNDTIFPELMINTGTQTQFTGSWTCRADGKLVATVIFATYQPLPANIYPNAPVADLILAEHVRQTGLFSVDDADTLTRLSYRSRHYTPAEDPTNPNAGQLGPLHTTQATFKRLKATDADLLAP